MDQKFEKDAKVFKAFCDENRLYILSLLESGEKCACKLLEALHIGQSTLSHHMKILCDAGVVNGRKEGKWVYYSIHSQGAKDAVALLGAYTRAEPGTEKCGGSQMAVGKSSDQHLKAYIDVRHCGANQDHCKPMKECPNEAIEIIPDETSGFGHRFVVNEEKCDGCGACIDICCGDCMELR